MKQKIIRVAKKSAWIFGIKIVVIGCLFALFLSTVTDPDGLLSVGGQIA